MILETTLENIDEFISKYMDLLYWGEGCDCQEGEDCLIGIGGYRIMVPELDVSIREGDLCSHHDDSEEEWEIDASVTVLYELNEKDPQKYLGWSTDDIQGTLYNCLHDKFNEYSDLDSVKCIIDTTEIIDDEEQVREIISKIESNEDEDDE